MSMVAKYYWRLWTVSQHACHFDNSEFLLHIRKGLLIKQFYMYDTSYKVNFVTNGDLIVGEIPFQNKYSVSDFETVGQRQQAILIIRWSLSARAYFVYARG